MIACLTKSDASEGLDQIIEFLNASSIKYPLTVNPNIYVSCIKQFWSSVSVKTVNDVTRLQALVDKKKVIITEATIREALRLDDAESIDCLPNEEIFTKLSRMGLVGNVDSSTKFYMYPRFLQLMIRAKVSDLSLHSIKYSPPTLTQKVFANMRRVGKGFFGVDTPLFEGMIVAQQDDDVADEGATSVDVDDVHAAVDEPYIPSPTPTTPPPPPSQDLPSTSQGGIIANMDANEDVTLKDVADIAKEVVVDAENEENDDELEPSELQELVEVVTTAKLMTEVVTAASATIIAADTPIPAAPSAARRRKKVVIRDPEETTTPSTIIHTEPKSKDKGK
nr:hypothetical protein [Tanacetum cinerariifolium]